MRYNVQIRACKAPTARGGKYRRPVVVRVLDSTASEWHAVRGMVPGACVEIARNVDSRYSGPRSAYGQAIERARELCAELNAGGAK